MTCLRRLPKNDRISRCVKTRSERRSKRPPPYHGGGSRFGWELHVGTIWAGLLRAHGVSEGGTVVEIGPGYSPKIGLALARLGFRGRAIIIEPSPRAGARTTAVYRALLPGAIIEHRSCDIEEMEAFGPVDALLANHVLDDLIVAMAMERRERNRMFDAFDCEEQAAGELRTWWNAAAGGLLVDAKCATIDTLQSLVSRLRPRLIGLS